MRVHALALSLALLSLACPTPANEAEIRQPPDAAIEDEALRDEVLAWVHDERLRWSCVERTGDVACGANCDEVEAAIARETDPERRAWMKAGQFVIGYRDCWGGSRPEVAQAVLDELGFDARQWSIHPDALALAVRETGRWMELQSELTARIATQHADVAAYLALVLYLEASEAGEWDRCEQIYAAYKARERELNQTPYGPMVRAFGLEPRMNPGNFLPDVCVEKLEGGELCIHEIDGYRVIELWETGSEESDRRLDELQRAHAALQLAYPDDPPHFVSINPREEPATILEYQRDDPRPWTNAWVPEAEREAFEATWGLASIPHVLIVGPDGRILVHRTHFGEQELRDRIHYFRSRHTVTDGS